jgi:serine/threonine-protein kinase
VSVLTQLNDVLAGRYEVLREVGAGGMATVYLARDVRHDRQVALKVLKPELGAVLGADRFLAEIKVTAHLQHPNLLPLFDSGEANGLLFYVMPFVEGESLRARLERERQLPIDEAVRIAVAIAGALDYAHQHHVIHRDLKPENILLQAGQPVVADFGIALAVTNAGGTRVTQTGLSLGTPQYMSPEQATGDRNVDGRTDLYSLGAMTYEMLTGELPHSGSTTQAIVAKLLTEEVRPLTVLRRSVPAHVDAAVRKALEKLPADRFESAKAFAAALTDSRQVTTATAAILPTSARRAPSRLTIALGTALLGMTLVAAWALTKPAPPSRANEVVRFSLKIGETEQRYLGSAPLETRFGVPVVPAMTLSPDGKLLVYAAWSGSGDSVSSRLYIRRLNEERAEPIPGTEGGVNPFFSPGGDWIGFFAGRALKRAPVGGGAPETIAAEAAPVGGFGGASWGDDGTIVYGRSRAVYRVAASGGTPTLVLPADTTPGAGFYAMPHLLPGSRVALLGAVTPDPAKARILALDVASGELTPVLSAGLNPVYVRTGHLLFVREGTLMAVGFDASRVEVRGEPVAVIEGVSQALNLPSTGWETGAAQFATSAAGLVAYAAGGVYESPVRALVRVSADGRTAPLGVEAPGINSPRLSPSGDRVVYYARTSARSRATAVFIRDLARGVTKQLASGGFTNWWPTWSTDGKTILFTSDREDGVSNLYTVPADGGAAPTRLAPATTVQIPSSWSARGVVAFLQDGDIWTVTPGGTPTRFVTSAATELYPVFSADGNWIAYTSTQGGRAEVYVRPYPGPEPATQVSDRGGSSPAWSPDGRRLFYLSPSERGSISLMAVDVAPGAPFRPGRPAPFIAPWTYGGSTPVTGYDVAKDGSFIAPVLTGGRVIGDERTVARIGEIHVVLNFLDELRARVRE